MIRARSEKETEMSIESDSEMNNETGENQARSPLARAMARVLADIGHCWMHVTVVIVRME